jgi:uncharacterized protein YndB with AHSA1/START domain
MTIAPIVQQVTVAVAPARAFDLFTRDIGRWWPRGQTIGQNPHADIVIEPQPGGRWFERDDSGAETDWGKVIDWAPPARLVLGWQLDASFRYNSEVMTEVVMSFEPAPGGGTIVTLCHQKLEGLGVDAAAVSDKLRGGWPSKVADFATYADAMEDAA